MREQLDRQLVDVGVERLTTVEHAVGNGIDRLAYGAVVDFVLLHAETATWAFNWYVFNLADVAIVAGVIGLLYESMFPGRAVKAP